MAYELIYTSAPKGLKPGTSGFCTVAATRGISQELVRLLESLSGYREVFPPNSQQAELNPVAYSHFRFSSGGESTHVLSRVAYAGLDYTGRFNKLGHHVALSVDDRAPSGPASVQRVMGFHYDSWDGAARYLQDEKHIQAGEQDPAPAYAWEAATGDAGWAGVLAQSYLDGEQAVVIYDPLHTKSELLLKMIDEGILLLPELTRWRVTYSTYFTSVPTGADCAWRFVAKSTTSEVAVPGSAKVIDLTSELPPAPSAELVEAARTGEMPTLSESGHQPKVVIEEDWGLEDDDAWDDEEVHVVLSPKHANGTDKLTPSPAGNARARRNHGPNSAPARRSRSMAVIVCLLVLVGIAIGAWTWRARQHAPKSDPEPNISEKRSDLEPDPNAAVSGLLNPEDKSETGSGANREGADLPSLNSSESQTFNTEKETPSVREQPITFTVISEHLGKASETVEEVSDSAPKAAVEIIRESLPPAAVDAHWPDGQRLFVFPKWQQKLKDQRTLRIGLPVELENGTVKIERQNWPESKGWKFEKLPRGVHVKKHVRSIDNDGGYETSIKEFIALEVLDRVLEVFISENSPAPDTIFVFKGEIKYVWLQSEPNVTCVIEEDSFRLRCDKEGETFEIVRYLFGTWLKKKQMNKEAVFSKVAILDEQKNGRKNESKFAMDILKGPVHESRIDQEVEMLKLEIEKLFKKWNETSEEKSNERSQKERALSRKIESIGTGEAVNSLVYRWKSLRGVLDVPEVADNFGPKVRAKMTELEREIRSKLKSHEKRGKESIQEMIEAKYVALKQSEKESAMNNVKNALAEAMRDDFRLFRIRTVIK